MREEYGATSTILTEYVRESHLEIESKIATALFYGIMAETQDLGRESTPADIAAAQFLYPYANKRRLGKIENARVPREYFAASTRRSSAPQIYDNVVVSVLPEVQYPDMVAEVADFLLRLDEVEWACAIGRYEDFLHVSLRTTERDVNAGDILQKVLGSRWAGGHDMIAGGRMRIDGSGPDAAAHAAEQVRTRLLATLGDQPPAAGRPLVVARESRPLRRDAQLASRSLASGERSRRSRLGRRRASRARRARRARRAPRAPPSAPSAHAACWRTSGSRSPSAWRERGHGGGIAGVAEHHGDVAEQAATPGARERRCRAKRRAKPAGVELAGGPGGRARARRRRGRPSARDGAFQGQTS